MADLENFVVECYDVGGTTIRGALISTTGKIVQRETVESAGGITFIDQIKELHSRLQGHVVLGTVIGLPGPVRDGVLLCAPPLGITSPINLRGKFKELSQPVRALNDLEAAVRAEKELGAGKEYKNICLVTISTGIGAAAFADGHYLLGLEPGHCVVETDNHYAYECSCGRTGCWVAQASGYAIAQDLRTFETDETLSVKTFLESGCSAGAIHHYKIWNARGLGNIINFTNSDAIVIMGSVGLNQFDKIIPSKEEIEKYTIKPVPKIIPTKLGDDIGLLGCMVYAKNLSKIFCNRC